MAHWHLVADERRALADLLEGLTDEQWSTPSLCGDWTVKDVAAHVMFGPTTNAREVARAFLRSGPNINRMISVAAKRRAQASTAELIALIRDNAESEFAPPTLDWTSTLADTMLHREDIAVPLGLPSDRPVDSWRYVLDFLASPKGARAVVGKGRPEVRAVATDLEWAHGSGPEIAGPAASLALALGGRRAGLDALSGPGADSLATWVGATP